MAKAKTEEKKTTKKTDDTKATAKTKAGTKQETKTQSKAKADTKQQSTGKKVQTHAAKLRKEIPELLSKADQSYLEAAERLSEVWHKGFFQTPFGYESFDAYCEAELPWKARSAKYLIEIFDKANLLNLPKERISAIGWTKMKDLVAILSKEMSEDQIEEWLTFAENNKASEVTEEVKKHRRRTRTSSGSAAQDDGHITWKLKMTESEVNIITDGLNEAKSLCDTTNDVVALEMIVQDWMEMKGNRPSRTTVEDAIQFLENAYGVIIEGYRNKGEAKNEKAPDKTDEGEADDLFNDDAGESEADGAKAADKEEPDEDDINDILGLDD